MSRTRLRTPSTAAFSDERGGSGGSSSAWSRTLASFGFGAPSDSSASSASSFASSSASEAGGPLAHLTAQMATALGAAQPSAAPPLPHAQRVLLAPDAAAAAAAAPLAAAPAQQQSGWFGTTAAAATAATAAAAAPGAGGGSSVWFWLFLVVVVLAAFGVNVVLLVGAGVSLLGLFLEHVALPWVRWAGFDAVLLVQWCLDQGLLGAEEGARLLRTLTDAALDPLARALDPRSSQPPPGLGAAGLGATGPGATGLSAKNELGAGTQGAQPQQAPSALMGSGGRQVQPTELLQRAPWAVSLPAPPSALAQRMRAPLAVRDGGQPAPVGASSTFCYVGLDATGQRVCATTADPTTCRSQQLFPTADQCVRPALRLS